MPFIVAVQTKGNNIYQWHLSSKVYIGLMMAFHVSAVIFEMVRSGHKAINAMVFDIKNRFSEFFPCFRLQIAVIIWSTFHV